MRCPTRARPRRYAHGVRRALYLLLFTLSACSTAPPPALDVELRPLDAGRSVLRFQVGDDPPRALVPGEGVGAIHLRRWRDEEGDKLSITWQHADGIPVDVVFGLYASPLRYLDAHDAPGERVAENVRGWVLQRDGSAEAIEAGR